MTSIAMQPVRTGNPGIVPPWLQGSVGTGAVGAVPTAPGTDAVLAHAWISPFGADVEAYLHDALRGARQSRSDSAGQQQVEEVVARVQEAYARLGVTDAEGNGPVHAEYHPEFPNAAYAPNGDREYGFRPDSINIGVDPRTGQSFADATDVIAHELGHRIVEHMTGGTFDNSPASEDVAVNESLADTFASLVDDDDWVIGDELAEPIRDMAHPERMGHPGSVAELKDVLAPGSPFLYPATTTSGRTVMLPDWHVVAGVPNKAAAIIGDRLGREKLGEIYLDAVRNHVRGGGRISGLAKATIQSAADLFGTDSRELQVTADAWRAVGLLRDR